MDRVVKAARLNLGNARMRLGIPWLVALTAFAINLVIFYLVRQNADGGGDDGVSGALAAMYFAVAAAHLQTMTQTFPFALSLGLTRRDFYLGTGLVVLGEVLAHSVLLTGLLAIEQVTGGWGLRVQFFGVPFLVLDNPVAQVAAYGGPLLALSFVGVLAGTVFNRWGQFGMYAAGIGVTVLLGGLVALATWQQWWPAVGAFFTTTPTLALTAAYPALLAVLCAAVAFPLVRRATP